jgi:hypothetical protein
MSDVAYPYANGNLLEQRNTYFYSAFQGSGFLQAWHMSRSRILATLPPPSAPHHHLSRMALPVGARVDTAELLASLNLAALNADLEQFSKIKLWIDRLVQRFEVSKRLYDIYVLRDGHLKAESGSSFRKVSLYLEFGELMVAAYCVSRDLPYLNALLKALDTLSAIRAELLEHEDARLAWLIVEERRLVRALAEQLKVHYET